MSDYSDYEEPPNKKAKEQKYKTLPYLKNKSSRFSKLREEENRAGLNSSYGDDQEIPDDTFIAKGTADFPKTLEVGPDVPVMKVKVPYVGITTQYHPNDIDEFHVEMRPIFLAKVEAKINAQLRAEILAEMKEAKKKNM